MSAWGLLPCFCIPQLFPQLGCCYGVRSKEAEVRCAVLLQAACLEHPSVGMRGLQGRGGQPAGRERASSLGSSGGGAPAAPFPCFLQT